MSESISQIHPPSSLPSSPTQPQPGDSSVFPDPLAPLVLPVDSADITDADIQKVTRLWPTCVPLFTFMGHPYLQERKEQSIKMLKLRGRIGYSLRTASARVLTCKQYTNTFSEETRMLDHLLTSVFACTTFTKDVVYKLDEDIYQELCAKLTARRKLASSSLHDFGYSDLEPPAWVISTAQGLTSNDFEMYAFHYRIHVEHFLHMLDYVHDWDRLQTRVYLDERLLAAQRDADRICLGKKEYHLPAVPPSTYSEPLKSKTSCQTSASDWSCGGVHGRDTRQHPNNPWAAEIQGQLYHKASRNSPTPYSDNSERKGIHSDVKLKMMNTATRDSSPETSVSCEGKPDEISTPSEVLNHNVSNSVLHHSTNSELRTFRIASNTLCAPFSGKNKTFRLPRRVRRRISQLLKRLQRVFYITSWVTSTNGEFQRILMGMREYVQPLPRFTILVSEETWVQSGMNTFKFDRDALNPVPDLGSYITSNSQKVLAMFSAQPKVRIKQKTNFREQTGRTKCQLHSPRLAKRGIEIKEATAPSTINQERQLYHWGVYNCQYPNHRRVHGEVVNRCFVIPLESSTNIPIDIRPPTTRGGLFDKQSISQETRQQRLYDPPHALVSKHFGLHHTNMYNILKAVRKEYLARRVCNPQKGLHGVSRGSRTMKRRLRTTQKSQHSRTVRILSRLAIRISTPSILNTAFDDFDVHSGCKNITTTSFYHIPAFTSSLADREFGEFLIHRDLCKLRNSRSPETPTMLRYLIAGHRIEVEKTTVPSTINRECQLYRWRVRNCCHPKCQSLRGEVQAPKYSMTSPGHNIKVKVNMKPQTTHRNIYAKQRLSRETHWQQEVFDLLSVGNWNMNRGLRTTRKWLSDIRRKSQRMKWRLHAIRKDQLQGAKAVLDPRQAVRNKVNPFAKFISEEKFSIASGYECTTTFSCDLPRFTLANKERREFHGHQALRKSQNSRLQENHAMLRDFIAELIDGQNHLQRIQSASRLEFCHQLIPELVIFPGVSAYPGLSIIAEVAVVKQESKRLLTNHPHGVVFNTMSPKRDSPDKSDHDQLNHNVRLINSSNDVPGVIFIIPITVYLSIASRNTESSLLPWSISVAPMVPLSKVDAKVLGHKRDSIDISGNELKDRQTLRQGQMLDAFNFEPRCTNDG
ncbi:hypothetical protein ARMGADRAFT_1093533 [Armillaria gallica]|uniref:Uncharacterized protein n=1 Tax=Armillaria gallica TaxID=47427 RepID=A0A2H3CQK2_ARMGA|nr:hypothetical protein ARMGADRAFT_1093533 [Armillaria gallica]